jgi:hypothetical protein
MELGEIELGAKVEKRKRMREEGVKFCERCRLYTILRAPRQGCESKLQNLPYSSDFSGCNGRKIHNRFFPSGYEDWNLICRNGVPIK